MNCFPNPRFFFAVLEVSEEMHVFIAATWCFFRSQQTGAVHVDPCHRE